MNESQTNPSVPKSPLYGEGWRWNHDFEKHPFFYTIQFPGLEEVRPLSNHKPNNYARLATVHAHLEARKRAMSLCGEDPMTFRIYENGHAIETHTLPGKVAALRTGAPSQPST